MRTEYSSLGSLLHTTNYISSIQFLYGAEWWQNKLYAFNIAPFHTYVHDSNRYKATQIFSPNPSTELELEFTQTEFHSSHSDVC